ncbi:MAG: hypothetical protein AAGI44_09980 [Pseudomonadota bacterium]
MQKLIHDMDDALSELEFAAGTAGTEKINRRRTHNASGAILEESAAA